ncbi:hypothetical protein CRE_23222 [Caenorhabditis remanei]|uniref:Reverse transcriptase domain-containing protein n=1 Tax=Caenorhabditis remanei TaxID=31234 RepID=E3NNZ5_CAERE|nr:hypothetical protein CRE_23222 [Caenorhabditis remanei]
MEVNTYDKEIQGLTRERCQKRTIHTTGGFSQLEATDNSKLMDFSRIFNNESSNLETPKDVVEVIKGMASALTLIHNQNRTLITQNKKLSEKVVSLELLVGSIVEKMPAPSSLGKMNEAVPTEQPNYPKSYSNAASKNLPKKTPSKSGPTKLREAKLLTHNVTPTTIAGPPCCSAKPLQNRSPEIPSILEGSNCTEQRTEIPLVHCFQSEGDKNKLQRRTVALGMGNKRTCNHVGKISIGYANCNSISNKLSKLDLLCEYYNFDVFCLSETKLDDSFTDSLLSINDNYSILRKDRNRHGGGVGILIAKHIRFVPVDLPASSQSAEVCAIDIFAGGTTIRIITAYHPNHGHCKSTLFDTLEYLLIPGKHTVLLGDFNMPCIDWNLLSAPDKACSDFVDFVVKHGLTQSVKSPTRFNPENILDLCLSNTGIISDVSVGDLFSDHCLIKVVLSCDRKSLKSLRKMINYRKGDYDSMNGILSRIDWPLLLANLPTNDMYSLFIGHVKELIHNYVPILEIDDSKVRHSPAIIKLQKRKLRIWKKEGNSLHYKSICASIKELLLEEHKKKFEDKLVKGNPKNFFKLINRKLKPSNFVGPIKSGNGILCDDHEKAECFLNTFSDVFVSDDGLAPSIEPRTTTLIDEVSYEPYVIEYVLSKLEPKCNNSPDGIPNIILKKLCTSIALPLSLIFNKSIRSGSLPAIWKTAIVIPIYKKGSRSDPGNYRPISLTCSISKVMEKLVRRSLVEHLTRNKLLSVSQYGFRSRMNTELQLLTYIGLIIRDLQQNNPVTSVYIDFRKAFDTISISKLASKLQAYGIQGELLRWINNFLSGRSQKVLLNGVCSNTSSVGSGVPQGSVLGPLLFILFINDIGDKLESESLLYADDLKIISPNAATIQKDLMKLSEWCQTWQMKVAPSKCEYITFVKSKRTNLRVNPKINIELDGLRLPQCDYIRDLGIIFSRDLSFDSHIKSILRRAQCRINILFNVLKNSVFDIMLKCYKVFIRPIMEYGSTLYSPTLKCLIRKVESVQKSFLYRCSKKFNFEYQSYFDTLEAYGLESLELRRLINDLVYLYKILVSNEFYSPNHSLRRHPYHIKSILSNNTKFGSQYLPNRLLSCWNSLPVHVFPVKFSSLCFKNNVKRLNLSKYLTLNISTY